MDADELLREAEEAAGDAGMEMLDARGLKRLTLALERKVGRSLGRLLLSAGGLHPSINGPLYPGWGLVVRNRHNCS
jgi:hypothetical protein